MRPAFQVDARTRPRQERRWGRGWLGPTRHLASGPVLVYATGVSGDRSRGTSSARHRKGRANWSRTRWRGSRSGWWQRGVRRLIVAGGETSGAVVKALGVDGLRIGPEIDPGVPWTSSLDDTRPLAVSGAEVRQLRDARFLCQGMEPPGMRSERSPATNPAARADLPLRQVDLQPGSDVGQQPATSACASTTVGC